VYATKGVAALPSGSIWNGEDWAYGIILSKGENSVPKIYNYFVISVGLKYFKRIF